MEKTKETEEIIKEATKNIDLKKYPFDEFWFLDGFKRGQNEMQEEFIERETDAFAKGVEKGAEKMQEENKQLQEDLMGHQRQVGFYAEKVQNFSPALKEFEGEIENISLELFLTDIKDDDEMMLLFQTFWDIHLEPKIKQLLHSGKLGKFMDKSEGGQ